jgi:hypothetical protein
MDEIDRDSLDICHSVIRVLDLQNNGQPNQTNISVYYIDIIVCLNVSQGNKTDYVTDIVLQF